jgi:hypothetical protein
MRSHFRLLWVVIFVVSTSAFGAPKPHVIALGKATSIKWFVGPAEDKALDLKVRPLYVDTRLKEFTLVRRAFRMNDSLPEESTGAPRWHWQRGGWLLVDRGTGKISQVPLPEFDAYYSSASWYRDYVAYCGVSDDGKKLYAVVVQLGRRKPILKKTLGEASGDDMPDSECSAPAWERQPVRVSFTPEEGQKLTYSVRGHAVDVVNDDDEASDAE